LTSKSFKHEEKISLIVNVVENQGAESNVMRYAHFEKQLYIQVWVEGLGPFAQSFVTGTFTAVVMQMIYILSSL
jgi:hypothetical protein